MVIFHSYVKLPEGVFFFICFLIGMFQMGLFFIGMCFVEWRWPPNLDDYNDFQI